MDELQLSAEQAAQVRALAGATGEAAEVLLESIIFAGIEVVREALGDLEAAAQNARGAGA